MHQFDLFRDGLDEAIEHDIDAFNKQSVQKRVRLSWDECLAELKETHQQFYQKTKLIPLQESSSNEEYRDWIEVQIEHYLHHTNQLEKWI